MKVLVLNGSPKKKSDTFRMAEAFLRGLNKNQEHEVQIVNVIDKKIAPLQGMLRLLAEAGRSLRD